MNLLFLIAFVIVLLFGFVVFRGAPYVPTQRRYLHRAFDELYKIGPNDTLIDVGSGDGVILRMASKRGAVAIGYEINPALVLISRLLSRNDKKVEVRLADFWFAKFPSELTIIYLFIVTRDSKKMARKLQKEADRLQKSFQVMSLGSPLHGFEPTASLDAYRLYTVRPLQKN